MIRDITIGRYYDSESVIHRMDPRTKLMGVLVYIISLFLVKNVCWYIGCLIVMLVLYKAAGVPFGYLLKGLRNFAFALLYLPVPHVVHAGRSGRTGLDIYDNKAGNIKSSADDSKDCPDDLWGISSFLYFNSERTCGWFGKSIFRIGKNRDSCA